jgi:hypothetical protein
MDWILGANVHPDIVLRSTRSGGCIASTQAFNRTTPFLLSHWSSMRTIPSAFLVPNSSFPAPSSELPLPAFHSLARHRPAPLHRPPTPPPTLRAR